MATDLQPALVPAPQRCEPLDGVFELDSTSTLRADPPLDAAAAWLAERLRRATGHPVPPATEATISFRAVESLAPEEFVLQVTAGSVRIDASGRAGALYGAVALLQLFDPEIFRAAPVRSGPWQAPSVRIHDWPDYSWRGVMLDVARRFMTVADILRFIDLMVVHRFNVLQLHLTDDQGWRMPVERYPRLTEVASWRAESQVGHGPEAFGDGRPHGGFYSAGDLREIVAYAAERGIEVIPEIDAPGHVQAAIAAYPRLGVGGVRPEVCTRWGIHKYVLNAEESTIEFFCDVLDEVTEIFDSEFVSIGGDEADPEQWRNDERTSERMRQLGLTTYEELQAWFVHRLADHLAARGKRILGWDDILTAKVPPSTTVLTWRGVRGALVAARAGLDVIMVPEDRVYLDYRQSDSPAEPIPVGTVTSLERSYGLEMVPEGLDDAQAGHIVGGQAALWSEHLDTTRAHDYAAFPRLVAISEIFWGTGSSFEKFEPRLRVHLDRLRALGVHFRPLTGPNAWQQRPDAPGWPRHREDREAELAQLTQGLKSL